MPRLKKNEEILGEGAGVLPAGSATVAEPLEDVLATSTRLFLSEDGNEFLEITKGDVVTLIRL